MAAIVNVGATTPTLTDPARRRWPAPTDRGLDRAAATGTGSAVDDAARVNAWPAVPSARPDPPSAGQGATTTILFTDLVDSTDLIARVGDDAAAALQLTHLAVLRRVLATHGGREVKSIGDGLMVAFSSALSAVRCAVAMQREAGRVGVDPRPRLRAGIHAGEPIADGDDLYGSTVIIASRLCDRAHGGQIIASGLVAALVGSRGDHAFDDLGALALKGIDVPVSAVAVRADGRADAAVAGAPSAAGPAGAPPQLPALLRRCAAGPLVGRAGPLSTLVADLEAAEQYGRRLTLLAGEPGIGKTRLAAELARIAHERGATVLFGRCEEEALVPLQPFVTALDYYAATAMATASRPELDRRLAGRDRELARLLPSMRGSVGDGAPAAIDDPETERYRLFEAVVALLDVIAERTPLVLVLDDLHWADRDSLLLLRHVMRAPVESRLLVVATYRDVEVSPTHTLTQVLADLRRESLWQRVRLQGLDVAEVGALIATATGVPTSPDLAEALWQETEGHPFFVQELIRHLRETGALAEPRGRLWTRRAIKRAGIPEGVRELVGGRLRRLDPSTREVLLLAAVAGHEFSSSALQAVRGVSAQEIYALLAPAVSSQVIEAQAEAGGRYAFSHTLIRDTLYGELAPHERARLHSELGEALERTPDHARGESHLSELAHHFLAGASSAEGSARAIEYAVAAAEQAARGLAFEKACDHYRDAIAALGERPDADRRRCELMLALGESEWNAGHYKRARASFGAAGDLAERLGLSEHLGRAALGFGGRIGFQASAPDPQLVGLLERALRLLGEASSPLRARVTGRLALALTHIGQPERQRLLSERSVAEARAFADDALLAEVLAYAGWARWSPDNLDERLRLADEVVALADGGGSLSLRLESRFWRVAQLIEAREMQRADADYAEFARLAEEARQPYHLWLVGVVRAMRALSDATDERAHDLVWEAFRRGEATENWAAMQVFSGQLLAAYGYTERTGEILAAARAMAEYFSSIALYKAGLALTYCLLGRLVDARPLFEELAARDFRDVPRDWLWLSTMDLLCEVCWLLRDERRAAILYDLLEPYAERNVVLGAWATPRGVAGRAVGLMASVAGSLDDGVRRFERAIEQNRKLRVGPSVVVAQLHLARALAARGAPGDRERAIALQADVAAGAEALNLRALQEPARALGARLGLAGAILPLAPEPRPPLRERASELGDTARAGLSRRGRAVIARRLAAVSDSDLERLFDHPLAQRALFTAMARAFQPRLALGFEGELGFELYVEYGREPRPPQWWTLRVAGGRAWARHRASRDAAMVAHLRLADFIRLVTGERNPVALWVENDVLVEGDVLIAPRLVDMFGGVSLAETLANTEDVGRLMRSMYSG
jgi:class 3 adenylate cyclase